MKLSSSTSTTISISTSIRISPAAFPSSKKPLNALILVVTDGEDNASRNSLEKMIREVQKTDTVIYTIGLLSQENKKEAKRARKVLEQIANASGGLAYFPENVDDVHS